ncbi:MAG: HNH endonuclease signature motif containing protein [Candidatus Omnitrophota bacterium]
MVGGINLGCLPVIILLPIIGIIYIVSKLFDYLTRIDAEAKQKKFMQEQAEEQRQRELEEEQRKKRLLERYKTLPVEEIIFNTEIERRDKAYLLRLIHGYQLDEAGELIDTAIKEGRKAKLSEAKRKIAQKAAEAYSNIPSDDERKPISDEVKMFVWQRDKGKCVKCGSQENLEYDHIIPVVKGGSNTERNIQLLCEKCNREKHDNIV